MPDNTDFDRNTFGGRWTVVKLDILEKYLNAYTTALKDKGFKLMYIDAFAGTGDIDIRMDKESIQSFEGSVKRALKVKNKSFDRLLFVENKPEYVQMLKKLRTEYPDRDINVREMDANKFLRNELWRENWKESRAVLFLDPFGANVEWEALKQVADCKALDTWILFSIGAVSRMLPKERKPDAIFDKRPVRLTTIFGDESWKDLYKISLQRGFNFGGQHSGINYMRDSGIEGILELYKAKLKSLFGPRFLDDSKSLKNTKNTVLFELMFCAGSSSSKSIGAAHSIAKDLINAKG